MTEEKTKKKKSKKQKRVSRKNYLSSSETQRLLVENFTGLQKAMTNLAIKFEGLSGQINSLLEIFELSAKNFVGGGNVSPEENRDILNKIDSLLEQNKTLAKGLVTLEEKLRPKTAQNPNISLQRRTPLQNG